MYVNAKLKIKFNNFLRWYQQGMEVIKIVRGYWRRWIGMFAIAISNIYIRGYYLQYTNFLSLNNRELVVVNPVITVHTLRKK